MTAAHLVSLFASLPWPAQFAAVLALVLLTVGLVTVSRSAGRAAGRIEERRRRDAAAERRRFERARDRHMRAVVRAPQSAIDQVLRGREIERAGELDLSGDDREGAER